MRRIIALLLALSLLLITEQTTAEKKHDLATTKLIGRLAEGIKKIKGNNFFVCGDHLSEQEASEHAIKTALVVVTHAQRYNVNVWGMAAIAAHESGFDYCALGPNPRKFLLDKELIKRQTRSLSYPREDLLSALKTKIVEKRFGHTGVDIGLCQVLSRFYDNDYSLDYMMTLAGSADICAQEMQQRQIKNKTSAPWLFWRGYKATWYADKIKRWARLLGANKNERL